MTINVDDEFLEAGANKLVTAHLPEIGGTYVARDTGSGSPVPTVIGSNAGHAIVNGGQSVVTNSAALTSATDWEITGYYDRLSVANYPLFRIYGQMTAAGAGYMAYLNYYANEVQLYKPTTWAAVGSPVAVFPMTLPADTSKLALKRVGAFVKVLLNDVERINFDDTAAAPSNLGLPGWGWNASGSGEGRIYRFTAVSSDPVPTIGGGVTLDALIAAGTLSTSAADMSGGVTLADLLAAGTLGPLPGALVTAPFRSTVTGQLLPNQPIAWCAALRVSDGQQVAILTGQQTNGAAVLSVQHGLIVPGVRYLLVTCDDTGNAYGVECILAAAA